MTFPTAIECEEPSVYRLFTSACPATCVNPNADKSCSEKPVEGCECPEGTLLDGDKCVPPVECGCRYEGRIYRVSIRWRLYQIFAYRVFLPMNRPN